MAMAFECLFLKNVSNLLVLFQHMKFVKKYLRATDLATDRQSVKKFVHKFLGFDGVFCMRMISAHAGDIMATELIVALWHNFNDRVRKSPIEMFEGGVSQSPSKLDNNFKTWLLGQTRYSNSSSYTQPR